MNVSLLSLITGSVRYSMRRLSHPKESLDSGLYVTPETNVLAVRQSITGKHQKSLKHSRWSIFFFLLIIKPSIPALHNQY